MPQMLVESAYGASQHLNIQKVIYYKAMVFRCWAVTVPHFNFYSLVSSGGEFQIFSAPHSPPPGWHFLEKGTGNVCALHT